MEIGKISKMPSSNLEYPKCHSQTPLDTTPLQSLIEHSIHQINMSHQFSIFHQQLSRCAQGAFGSRCAQGFIIHSEVRD